jgi:atypical dual specificity phosphatase
MLGMSRSASMVLMYLMRGEKMTLREAWDLTKRARYIILPNPFFARVLVHYEKQLFGKNTMTYVEVNKLCLQMYE